MKEDSDFDVIYQINNGNGSEILMEGSTWFKSSDVNCPVTKYSLEYIKNKQYVPLAEP